MTDDAQLLQRYARERSEEAFAELVRRHLALVYHAALRQCGGDAHLAEDAAQAVFVDLARKAAALAEHRALAGWLHTSARYAAIHAVRTAARRQVREQEAHAVNEANAGEAAVDAEQLRPVLDTALHALGETDRAAVLLRFFEGRGYAEIGASLALNEDAARRRVDRALEKLRGLLARRGIRSTAEALGLALAGEATQAAPAGLAATVTGAAVAVAPAGGVVAAVIFMSMTKIQISLAAAVIAVGAAGLVWQHRTNQELEREVTHMQQQDAELAKLRTENDRLIARSVEQAQTTLAAQRAAKEPAPAAQESPGAARVEQGVPLAPGLTPVTSLGNAGRATPRATFATQLWAARGGDVELEATTLTFDEATRAKLEALRATLSPELRAQYPTPEQLMAFVLSGSPHPVGGMQVTGETPQDADNITLHTEWQHVDDDIVHKSDVQFRRDGDSWKWVVPASLVNRAAAYLRYTGASSGGK